MQVSVNAAIGDIDAAEWNGLGDDDCPFLRHEFLAAAEDSGSVSAASGWTPRHLTCRQDGRLVGAMPLYEKSHSWGEFVFDWAWARAYEQAGLSYYPKLAVGPRAVRGDARAGSCAPGCYEAGLT